VRRTTRCHGLCIWLPRTDNGLHGQERGGPHGPEQPCQGVGFGEDEPAQEFGDHDCTRRRATTNRTARVSVRPDQWSRAVAMSGK